LRIALRVRQLQERCEEIISAGAALRRKVSYPFVQLGGLGVLRVVWEGVDGGGEDPWLCEPGFGRECLFVD
jgi:hypothetical protein